MRLRLVVLGVLSPLALGSGEMLIAVAQGATPPGDTQSPTPGTGVIKPPANVDPGINKAPVDPTPEAGRMPVVPPPGTKGGDPTVEPK